jgi:hypothetical protein
VLAAVGLGWHTVLRLGSTPSRNVGQNLKVPADRVRRTDPDAANLWGHSMRNWHAGCRRLTEWLDREGRLAPPWTVAAASMLWALISSTCSRALSG